MAPGRNGKSVNDITSCAGHTPVAPHFRKCACESWSSHHAAHSQSRAASAPRLGYEISRMLYPWLVDSNIISLYSGGT